jgi:hypothetical protein
MTPMSEWAARCLGILPFLANDVWLGGIVKRLKLQCIAMAVEIIQEAHSLASSRCTMQAAILLQQTTFAGRTTTVKR